MPGAIEVISKVTKVCARCHVEKALNEDNYPHGSSWCTVCCPVPDSDED